MPKVNKVKTDKTSLYDLGVKLVFDFCKLNKVKAPEIITLEKSDPMALCCGYYRENVITICPDMCASAAAKYDLRKWSWPGSASDRTVYGVLAHELGHHFDRTKGKIKYNYSSEYCTQIKILSDEPALTSYGPNPAEWFAEMFRLFVTNPKLLKVLRPKTYSWLHKDWEHFPSRGWKYDLLGQPHQRIVDNLQRKVNDAKRRRKK